VTNSIFQSIWLSDFQTKSQFDLEVNQIKNTFSVFDWIEDRIITSRHPFFYPAYCEVCGQVTEMKINWMYGGWSNLTESIHPAWTETGICNNCGLNSRMRALFDFLINCLDINAKTKTYIAEEVTPFYKQLKRIVQNLEGSEFLDQRYPSGKLVSQGIFYKGIHHQDLTNLSFPSSSFDLMITLDVFEHIPDFRKAFDESYRILSPDGYLVFTIPFSFDKVKTVIRATIDKENNINHLLPPEIHGNPVSNNGSLCYQNFGWDILDELKLVGFKNTKASLYWGPWKGHLGYPFFVFSAEK